MTYSNQNMNKHAPHKMWRYQVTATLVDSASTQRYIDWLFAGHVSTVCHWASTAEVVHLQRAGQPSQRVMSVYWFRSKEDFDLYERDGAPHLRAEGIQLAKSLGGISFERELGWAWNMEASE